MPLYRGIDEDASTQTEAAKPADRCKPVAAILGEIAESDELSQPGTRTPADLG